MFQPRVSTVCFFLQSVYCESSVSAALCVIHSVYAEMLRMFRDARRVSICALCGEYRADPAEQWGGDLMLERFLDALFFLCL